MIPSTFETDEEVLQAIRSLYLADEPFDYDPTYSRGNFYKGSCPVPTIRSDNAAQSNLTFLGDVCAIPLRDNMLGSLVFDPPFMFGTHGQTKNNLMNLRFTMFDTWEQLVTMYQGALAEFHRILRQGGIIAFKCQDYTDSKTTITHALVHEWALAAGFKPEDIFIRLVRGGRIYNPKLRQRHARKTHCYWYVFRKRGRS